MRRFSANATFTKTGFQILSPEIYNTFSPGSLLYKQVVYPLDKMKNTGTLRFTVPGKGRKMDALFIQDFVNRFVCLNQSKRNR